MFSTPFVPRFSGEIIEAAQVHQDVIRIHAGTGRTKTNLDDSAISVDRERTTARGDWQIN
jgi:hypothetical protein